MANDFSREWVSTLINKVDKAVKSQSKKDLRDLRTAITKEINAMKNYRRYYEKTYGTAGVEYKSEEFQFLKKAQKQLLQVREQIDNKINDPNVHRVSYFKILNLAKEAKAKFKASFEEAKKSGETKAGGYKQVSEKVKFYARQNVDKIFIDMFHRTKRSDFQMIGEALQKADSVLNKIGMSVSDMVKNSLANQYDELSSDTAFATVLDVQDELKEMAQVNNYSQQEAKIIKQASEILRGAIS